MRLRRVQDYRTLLWVGALVPLFVILHYTRPTLGLWLLPVSCYFAIACGVIAHNHMHRPTLHGKLANELFPAWISVFYGYPVFAWLPTHNLNHHKLVNRRDRDCDGSGHLHGHLVAQPSRELHFCRRSDVKRARALRAPRHHYPR